MRTEKMAKKNVTFELSTEVANKLLDCIGEELPLHETDDDIINIFLKAWELSKNQFDD